MPHLHESSARRDRDCLNFNPFEGDRDCHTKELSDRMVIGRCAHQCQICTGPIIKGERHRALTEVSYDDRKVMTFRFCALCCDAMAKNWTDDGKAILARYSIGYRARKAKSNKPPDYALEVVARAGEFL